MKSLLRKVVRSLEQDGLAGFLVKLKNWIIFHLKFESKEKKMKDILFINGCALSHPERYRVDHQMEQLMAAGMEADKITVGEVTPELIKYYRGFVIFRCPITPQIVDFIDRAKYFNKKVFFDVDDLVINRKYTDTVPYVQQMSPRDKFGYDLGVEQMEDTLKRCDYLITTTTGMKKGLEMYEKDIYVNRNVVSEEMVKLSLEALKNVKKDSNKIVIGYLSGSITHNPDIELIKPVLLDIMEKYENVELMFAGILDVPEEFKKFEKRVYTRPFGDWRKLPEIIAGLDINLAPLTKSVFNEAKSENKWTEAALCKVVTVASDLGAFKEVVKDGRTGILCKNMEDWRVKLSWLIENTTERQKIAENAYEVVSEKYITTYSGKGLVDFIESKLAPNIGMVLPSTNVSGGVMVAMKHCHILREHGYDVTILNMMKSDHNIGDKDGEINVVSFEAHDILARFNTMVATMHVTLDFVKEYPEVKRRLYLVQSKETDFYENGTEPRVLASATYNEFADIEYITISKWCQEWLWKDYGKRAKYAPNGIDVKSFGFRNREFNDGSRIKILIEGDSESGYKNVDESFRVVEELDKNKYEIIYLSYQGKPKSWYRVDKFYYKIPHDAISKVYEEADILLKSSIVESFSYPPLEMMATGGLVVVAPNAGNVEYLKNEENCLFYKLGDIDDAIKQIERLVENKDLRKKLVQNGKRTVDDRNWKKIEKEIVGLYGDTMSRRKEVAKSWELGSNKALLAFNDVDERKKLIKRAIKEGKKVAVYLVESKTIAQFRYRCYNVLAATLGSDKWQAVYFTDAELGVLREVVSDCNLFIIERRSELNEVEREIINICRENNIKVIFDIDDLVFDMHYLKLLMKSVNSKNLLNWVRYFYKIRGIAKKANGYLVTNNYLGGKIKESLQEPYKVIHNSLNTEQVEASELYRKNKMKDKVFKVGYFSGTPTHSRDFQLVLPELKRFLDEHDDTVVEIVGFMKIGNELSELARVGKLRFLSSVDFRELQRLMSEVDVNIAPLVVNDFTNCKSELKYFESAIVDTTTIASPTYTFSKAIKDGENGFLAKPGEWYSKLEYLYNHPEENKKIARRAREHALKHYYGEEFLDEVEEAYDYFEK